MLTWKIGVGAAALAIGVWVSSTNGVEMPSRVGSMEVAEQKVTPRLFAFRRLLGVLAYYSTPSFIAAINFNKEVLAWDLIPKVQRRVDHHGFNIMISYIVVRATDPFVTRRKDYSFAGETM